MSEMNGKINTFSIDMDPGGHTDWQANWAATGILELESYLKPRLEFVDYLISHGLLEDLIDSISRDPVAPSAVLHRESIAA